MMKVILMADIIGSSKKKAKTLMADLKSVVARINDVDEQHIEQHILSPITITLGDEFQAVIKSIDGAVRVIFDFEQQLMSLKKPFKLRYIVHEGVISTDINPVRAHEMLGPGLTEARTMLTEMKTSKKRFKISTSSKEMETKLNLMFSILQGLIDRWTAAQQKVVVAFLELNDYHKVAERLKKDPTTMWRRKKTLMIEEFYSLKKLIILTINGKWRS